MSFVNLNTWHLICNNFNFNFIFDIVCLFVCVCAFSLRRESPDMILGDKPLIFEVVLSQSLRVKPANLGSRASYRHGGRSSLPHGSSGDALV
jgi:hypothetical protein